MRVVGLRLTLTFLSAISFACSSEDGKDKKKASDNTIAQELVEDSKRPFLPLLASSADVKTLEYWQPTGKTTIWTPKGDAEFFAGRGAIVDLRQKTLQFYTKEKLDARAYGDVAPLSEPAFEELNSILTKLNRVEQAALSRPCSLSSLDQITHLNLSLADKTLNVANFRYAQCQADFVDTLSMRRLEEWLITQGAPWEL